MSGNVATLIRRDHPFPCFRGFIGKEPERPTCMVLWSWRTAQRNQLASRSPSNFLKKTQLLGLRVMTPSSPCSTNCFFDPVDGFYVHIQHTPAESGNTGRFRPSACLFY